jgi:tetraacyldisaccharide 4'-kinase
MNFNAPKFLSIRLLLLPFSLIYYCTIVVRNKLYHWKILASFHPPIPTICIGNLSVGGTGKSPMVEYLINVLQPTHSVATLSRGYQRKTKGYVLANNAATATMIGDEPMQFHAKFPDLAVAVSEKRKLGIEQLIKDAPNTTVIILDDAFQHRAVTCTLNIVLTTYDNLYVSDCYLPTGNLRDEKKSIKRAQIVVVTKCNPLLPETSKKNIAAQLKLAPHQFLFFSTTAYGTAYHWQTKQPLLLNKQVPVLLLSGIAQPAHLEKWVTHTANIAEKLYYPDHHSFTKKDIINILFRWKKIEGKTKIILTTEKDAVRLIKFEQEMEAIPLYVLPISLHFLFNEKETFDKLISQPLITT